MTQKTVVEVRDRLKQKSIIIRRLFSTPDGMEVLKVLDEEFTKGKMFTPEPLQTAYLLGARDVVLYIQQLLVYGDK
jgi:hypothetical protein